MNIESIFSHFIKKRKIIRKFREAGAYTIDFAKSLKDLDLKNSMILIKLKRHGVIVDAGDKNYYLDERALMQYRLKRTKWGMVLLFLILLIVLAFVKK